ncbi:MAG: glycosyltransferase [Chthoniobacteraceae bacterium]
MPKLSTPGAPVAAQYIATFAKPEMLHIYRQVTGLRRYAGLVLCQKRENPVQFPYEDLVWLPKPRTHQLRRLWQKQILGRPITIYPSEARRIEGVLAKKGAKVLHVYFGHIGVHLLPLLERRALPTIVSFHGADAQVDLHRPAHREASLRMLDAATLILARSESLLERIAELGCDPGKLRLHRTGLPLAEIPYLEHAAPADGAWHCVQASRLIPKKGLATTIRAFAQFSADFPNAKLTLAGSGPQEVELRKLAEEVGVADRVHFAGFLQQRELRELFARAHLFLHPSEVASDGDQEGVPNSMLEAMASGLPICATRHGGIPEAVEHGESGLLVAERDHGALAAAMKRLAEDAGLYRSIARCAAERVRERFDLAAQTEVLEGLYDEARERHSKA